MINFLSISSIFSSAWSIVVAILVLLFMVTIHEFGHYIVGKKLGFKINEFSIGFGPAIFKRKMKSGEFFSIRVLPLGGYCAFDGEDEDSPSEQSFEKQAPWKRILVLIAGAFMNFFVTLLIVIVTFVFIGQYTYKVAEVLPIVEGQNISAENSLQKDDFLLSINGKQIYVGSELSAGLAKANQNGDKFVEMEIIRNGERQIKKIELRDYIVEGKVDGVTKTETRHGLGMLQGSDVVKFGFFESIGRANVYCFKMAGEVLGVLGQLFTGKLGIDALGGPITTISITAQIAASGLRALLEIVAMIGVNLAVFNLLPIPALDGSKVVFTVVEWIRGKPINRKVESYIHFAGLIFLFGFAILVDVLRWI
ncbi:MAG: M50 family metallopeptidase [Clostridia bacterium]